MTEEPYFEDGKFVPSKLVKDIASETIENYLYTPTTDKGGDVIWKYHHDLGIFKPDGIPYVEQRATQLLGDKVKAHRVSEVVKLVQIETYLDKNVFEEDPNIVVLLNGAYHLDSGELTDYNAIHNAKSRIPVNYNPQATCPKILQFLSEVIPENVETFQEWMGYHLLKDYRFQKYLNLIGDGANGKTTLINLMIAFLGSENVSNHTLYELISDKFAKADLQGKLSNLASDIASDELKRTGALKGLTGNDWTNAQKKFQQSFDFKNYAKLTFPANQLPRTPDQSRAFFRRFLPITCPNKFEGDNCDPNILEKLTTEEELSGFFNWALKGLKRLLKNGVFTKSLTTEQLQAKYELMSDPVTAFIDYCVEKNPDGVVAKDDFYKAYYWFCKDRGFAPVLKGTLSKEIKPRIPGLDEGRRGSRGNRKTSWVGVSLSCQGCQGCQGSILLAEKPNSQRSIFTLDTLDTLDTKLKSLYGILREYDEKVTEYTLIRRTGVKAEEIHRLLLTLQKDGRAFMPTPGYWKAVV